LRECEGVDEKLSKTGRPSYKGIKQIKNAASQLVMANI